MDTHEKGGGQIVLHLFHTEQGDDRLLIIQVNLQVFTHALYITDIADGDAHHAIVGLHEYGTVGLYRTALLLRRLLMTQVVLLLHLQGCPQEIVHAERLQQIVHGIHLIAFHGIFRVGRGEDDEWGRSQLAYEIHTAQVGHVDITEDSIYHLLLHQLLSLQGTMALACQFQERHLIYICH